MRALAAAHCRLEPQTAEHAAPMFEVLSDPAIYEFENEAPPSPAWLAERFRRLESRRSPQGDEAWLNWVVRLPGGELAGFVQATVQPTGCALIAYQLASRHWRQGIGSDAVAAMLDELAAHHAVHTFVAVLKARNHRSLALLRRLGFGPAGPAQVAAYRDEPDEIVMVKAAQPRHADTKEQACPR